MNYHKHNPSTYLKNKLQGPITNSTCDSYVSLRISDDPKISEQLPSLTHTFLAKSLVSHEIPSQSFSILSQTSTTISHFLFSIFPLTFFFPLLYF